MYATFSIYKETINVTDLKRRIDEQIAASDNIVPSLRQTGHEGTSKERLLTAPSLSAEVTPAQPQVLCRFKL